MRYDISASATWIALALVIAVIAACGSAPPAATPSATAPPRGPSLRGIDFTAPPYATDLSRRAGGGEITSERTQYVDLTGDGAEEAVVVVESGGTLGDLGVGVYQAAASGASLVYFRKLAGRVEVRAPALVVLEGAPAPGDPECCPSQVRESVIEWRNGTFEVTATRTVPNGGAATPGR